MPYVDVDMYSNNKAFELPPDIQDSILKEITYLYGQAQKNIKYSVQYYAVKDFLEQCGIYVEHSWPFHDKNEFFFPGYRDAELFQIYLDEIVG